MKKHVIVLIVVLGCFALLTLLQKEHERQMRVQVGLEHQAHEAQNEEVNGVQPRIIERPAPARVPVADLHGELEQERARNVELSNELDRVRLELAAELARTDELQAKLAAAALFGRIAVSWGEVDPEVVHTRLFEIDLIAEDVTQTELVSFESVDAALLKDTVLKVRDAEKRYRSDVRALKRKFEGEAFDTERTMRVYEYQDEMQQFYLQLVEAGVGEPALRRFRRNHMLE